MFSQNEAQVIKPATVASDSLGDGVGQGGAIYYSCIDSYDNDCQVFLNSNTFTENSSSNQGGATIYVNAEFILDEDKPNIFEGNEGSYGKDEANFA